jgi:hypothetical protein
VNPRDAQASGLDLQTALYLTLEENQKAIDDQRAQAVERAAAQSRYKQALAKEMTRIRMETSIPASMAKDAAFADDEVAEAYYASVLQDGLWEACREVTMLRKREVDTIREELARMHTEGGWR